MIRSTPRSPGPVPPGPALTHLPGPEPATTLCGQELRQDSSFRVTRHPTCGGCRQVAWATAREAAGDLIGAEGGTDLARQIMDKARELLGEPYPLMALPSPHERPAHLDCPVCGYPAEPHCESETCDLWRCGNCRSFGAPGKPWKPRRWSA